MMNRLSIAVGSAVALALHILFGWIWGVAGALVAGFLAKKRSSLGGAISLTVAWALLIGWNMAVAPAENLNMMETMGNMLGGLPGIVIPVVTLLIAFLLGWAAGWLGGALKPSPKA